MKWYSSLSFTQEVMAGIEMTSTGCQSSLEKMERNAGDRVDVELWILASWKELITFQKNAIGKSTICRGKFTSLGNGLEVHDSLPP